MGLSATPEGTSQISLSWISPATDGWQPDAYNIYKGTSPGGESLAATPDAINGTGYTVTGLSSGTTYYFKVSALYECGGPDGCVESAQSEEVFATTSSPTLAAPTGLTATAAGSSQIRLSWTAPTPTEGTSVTGYKIYDGTKPGGESPDGGSGDSSDTVAGLTSGTTYYFEVSAVYQVCSDGVCSNAETSRSNEAHAATDHVTPGLKSQVIHFGPLTSHVVGVSFTISASASSGLQVSFGSATPRVCSVSDSQVTTLKRGRCTITATQAGSTEFAPAPGQTQSFRVKRAVGRLHPQTITFARPADVPAARRPVRLSASASSGLPVSFRSDTPDVCSVSGRVVTTVKRGRCTITAIQAGNAHYAAAPDQTRSFRVGPVPAQVPRALVIVLTALVVAAAAGALVLWRRWLRRRRPETGQPPPPPPVRAEPHPDLPGTTHLRVTGPEVSGTVRIEPHQAYVYSRMERAQR